MMKRMLIVVTGLVLLASPPTARSQKVHVVVQGTQDKDAVNLSWTNPAETDTSCWNDSYGVQHCQAVSYPESTTTVPVTQGGQRVVVKVYDQRFNYVGTDELSCTAYKAWSRCLFQLTPGQGYDAVVNGKTMRISVYGAQPGKFSWTPRYRYYMTKYKIVGRY